MFGINYPGSSYLGQYGYSISDEVSVTGVFSTGEIGTVIVTGTTSVILTGVEAVGSIGTIAVTGTALITSTGVEAVGSIGTIAVTGTALITSTGVEAVGSIGTVTVVTDGSCVVNVTGVEAHSYIGTVTVEEEFAGGDGYAVEVRRKRRHKVEDIRVRVSGVCSYSNIGYVIVDTTTFVNTNVIPSGIRAVSTIGSIEVNTTVSISEKVTLTSVTCASSVEKPEIFISTHALCRCISAQSSIGLTCVVGEINHTIEMLLEAKTIEEDNEWLLFLEAA